MSGFVYLLVCVQFQIITASTITGGWKAFTILICLSWIVAFMDFSLNSFEMFGLPSLGEVGFDRQYCDSCSDSLLHTDKHCQPPVDLNPTSSVSRQLGHIRQNVVRFTLPATMKRDTPLCLPRRIPEHFLALDPA